MPTDGLDITLEELLSPALGLESSPHTLGENPCYATPRVAENGAIEKGRVIPGLVVKELDVGDIISLTEAKVNTTKPLKAIRDSHHRVARLLAESMPIPEIALLTGYAISTLRLYQNDPSMKDLVVFYQKQRDEIAVDLSAKYKALVGDVHGELQERLSEDPESFGNGLLFEIMKDLGDRVGMGPTSKLQATLTIGVVDAETIQAIKERADGSHRGVVIQGKAREVGGKVIDGESVEITSHLRSGEQDRDSGERPPVSEESGEEAREEEPTSKAV